jgi:hypothetical protein
MTRRKLSKDATPEGYFVSSRSHGMYLPKKPTLVQICKDWKTTKFTLYYVCPLTWVCITMIGTKANRVAIWHREFSCRSTRSVLIDYYSFVHHATTIKIKCICIETRRPLGVNLGSVDRASPPPNHPPTQRFSNGPSLISNNASSSPWHLHAITCTSHDEKVTVVKLGPSYNIIGYPKHCQKRSPWVLSVQIL